jgi:hypothetical protein
MITSWKDFFIAVEQMRECQKEFYRTNSPSALMARKRCEQTVDNCIIEKRAEWQSQIQKELFSGGAAC